MATVARRWLRSLPDEVILARTGGDEFALAIPQMSKAAATELVEVLLERAREPISADGTLMNLTCSVGVTAVEPGEPYTAALKAADRILYEVKADGRDAHAVCDGREVQDEPVSRL